MQTPDSTYRLALSLIAHELNSPASIVNGYLRLLRQVDAERLTEQQRRMLEQTGTASGRLLRLIREVSDLAALEDGSPVVRPPTGVPVFPLCQDVIESVAREDGSPVPIFRCEESDRLAIVDADAGSLKRAFGALMAATARQHGTDQLECHGFINDDRRSPHAVIAFGRQPLAAVQDDIVANRVTFDRWRGGTGLSVPIACRIIEMHGGSVWSWCAPSHDPRAASVWSLPIVTPLSLRERV